MATYYLAKTSSKNFYGTDPDVVAKAARSHEWKESGHAVEQVEEGELSDWVSRDHRPIRRVYTEEEMRGNPNLSNP
jgi:hypothetical protein